MVPVIRQHNYFPNKAINADISLIILLLATDPEAWVRFPALPEKKKE
jgi:hypothetical protein